MVRLLVFLIITLNVMMSGSNLQFKYIVFLYSFLILCNISLLLYSFKIKKNNISNFIIILFILLLMFCISFYLSGTSEIIYILILIAGTALSFISIMSVYRAEEFRYIFFDFIYYFCLYSCFGFILTNVFSGYLEVVYFDNLKSSTLFNLWNANAKVDISYLDVFRNQSFFWEPGILQFYGNLLLLISLFNDRINKRYFFVAIFCVLSTFSASGFITMGIIMIAFMAFRMKISIEKKILIIFVSIPIILTIIFPQLDSRISGASSASGFLRFYDIKVAIDIFYHNFIGGVGYDINTVMNLIGKHGIERGNTNGFFMIFVYFGFFIGSVFYYLIYKQRIFKNKFLFFIIFLIYALSEPITLFPITFIFLLSSLFMRNYEN